MKLKMFLLVAVAFTTTACAQVASTALDTVLDSQPSYTEQQAKHDMEALITKHATSQGTTPGPMQTVCTDAGDESYACVTFLKENMIVMYGDCSEEGCKATGYDKVEEEPATKPAEATAK